MSLEATQPGDSLTLLGPSLLDRHAELKHEFIRISRSLHVPIGWHYLMDLVWAANEIRAIQPHPARVLDAGAGVGLMQWWLAKNGVEVVSVDRTSRSIGRRMRAWTHVVGLAEELPTLRRGALTRLRRVGHPGGASSAREIAGVLRDLVLGDPTHGEAGQIRILEADLGAMSALEDESVDAIVSISSLEHNAREALPQVVAELMRVLRPGGRFIATVGAAGDDDWYHEPSAGWCFSEATLRSIFGLSADCSSNFQNYEAILADVRVSAELRDNLAPFYFRSGSNGMPWGRWDPKYLSVGIAMRKRANTAEHV